MQRAHHMLGPNKGYLKRTRCVQIQWLDALKFGFVGLLRPSAAIKPIQIQRFLQMQPTNPAFFSAI